MTKVNHLKAVNDSSFSLRWSMTKSFSDSCHSAQGSQWLKSFSSRRSVTEVIQVKAVTGPLHGPTHSWTCQWHKPRKNHHTTLVVAMLKSMQSLLHSTVRMRLKLQWKSMTLIHWKPKMIPCSVWNGCFTTLPLLTVNFIFAYFPCQSHMVATLNGRNPIHLAQMTI